MDLSDEDAVVAFVVVGGDGEIAHWERSIVRNGGSVGRGSTRRNKRFEKFGKREREGGRELGKLARSWRIILNVKP